MVTQLESREMSPGVKKLHALRGDVAVVFSGRAFLENIEYLRLMNSEFAQRDLGWSAETAGAAFERAFKISRLTGGRELTSDLISMIADDPGKARQIPSTILLRKETHESGQYFGIGSQRLLTIPSEKYGETQAYYQIFRALDKQYRGKGRGRFFIEIGLMLHDQAQVFLHRSGNVMAIVTNTRSQALVQENRHPLDSSYSEDDYAYEIGKAVTKIICGEEAELEPTGVIRGAYKEPNRAFVPDPAYRETYDLHNRMIRPVEKGGWGVELDKGDVVLPFFYIK